MKRLRPSPALVVALLALVVALSGTAYAVAKSDGDAIIKKQSLSGNRLKANTVKGSKIKESSLGTVPRAQDATSADSVSAPNLVAFAFEPEWGPNPQSTGHQPGWRKDISGFVHLQGNLVGDGLADLIATLPAGPRPGSGVSFAVPGIGDEIPLVVVGANGQITLLADNLSGVSLEGISFYPDA